MKRYETAHNIKNKATIMYYVLKTLCSLRRFKKKTLYFCNDKLITKYNMYMYMK